MSTQLMDPQAKLLILLAASPFLVLTLHAVVSRSLTIFRPGVSPQKVCIWCVLFGNIPMGLLLGYFVLGGAAAQNVEVLPAVLYALVAYNALGYCYFHTYNMSETGRRVRILYELYRSGGLGAPEIASLYDVEDMLAVRIERLLSMGQVKVQNGRYVLDGRMLYYAARIMAFWGELIGSPQLKSFAKKTE